MPSCVAHDRDKNVKTDEKKKLLLLVNLTLLFKCSEGLATKNVANPLLCTTAKTTIVLKQAFF